MKKITILLSFLFTLYLCSNVIAKEAYCSRGLIYIPIEETFKQLGYDVEAEYSSSVVDVKKADNKYTIYLSGDLIVKRFDGKSETFKPYSSTEKIRTDYYISSNALEEAFNINVVKDESNKELILTDNGKSYRLSYKNVDYSEIENSRNTNAEPKEKDTSLNVAYTGFLVDGVAFAPLRYTFESLGYDVQYKSSTSTIYLRNATNVYEISINADSIVQRTSEGKSNVFHPGTLPKKIGASYYLPLRVMADILEADVSWNSESKTAHISKDGKECYLSCGVYIEPTKNTQTNNNGSKQLTDEEKETQRKINEALIISSLLQRPKTGYVFLPNGQVVIVQTN